MAKYFQGKNLSLFEYFMSVGATESDISHVWRDELFELCKSKKKITNFLDEQIMKIDNTSWICSHLLTSRERENWKEEWMDSMRLWLSKISITSVSIFVSPFRGSTEITETVLLIIPSIQLLIKTERRSNDEKECEDADGNIIREVWSCEIVSDNCAKISLNLFGINTLDFTYHDKDGLCGLFGNVWYLDQKKWHPVISKLLIDNSEDIENAKGKWVNLNWPKLVIGHEEVKFQEEINRRIVLYTFSSLVSQCCSFPLTDFIGSCMHFSTDWITWTISDWAFTMKMQNKICRITISLYGDDVYCEEMWHRPSKRKFILRKTCDKWQMIKNNDLVFIEKNSKKDVLCFVKWLLLTSAELRICFNNSDSRKDLENNTTLGSIVRKFRKIQNLLILEPIPKFPKDISKQIMDYCLIDSNPPIQKFLKIELIPIDKYL
jgi:hypothetical protein